MAAKLVSLIRNEEFRKFVEETTTVLDTISQKALAEYEELLVKSGTLVNEKKSEGGKSEVVTEAMSRKHFRAVASAIKNIEDKKKRYELASHHAEIFSKENPRFDRQRFLAACDVDEASSDQVH